jgi:hypothetical protein
LHLYWNTLEQALGASTLTVIDPAAKGRQNLLMLETPATPALLPSLGIQSEEEPPLKVQKKQENETP